MKHKTLTIQTLRGDPEKNQFSIDEAKEIAQNLNIDFSKEKFDLNQYWIGINVELEHGTKFPETNVTNNDPLLSGKIALAHLWEFPDYYDRLKKLEIEATAYWSKANKKK